MAGSKRKRAAASSTAKPQHLRALGTDDASLLPSKTRRRAPRPHQEEDELLSSKLSAKILKEALSQQREIAGEVEGDGPGSFAGVGITVVGDGSESDDELSETQMLFDAGEIEIDPEDERILEAFMKKDAGPQPTLADIIARKIKEKGAEA